MGLRPEHHGELNRQNVTRERFQELRIIYENDPVALQRIDVYDPLSEYHTHWKAFRTAVEMGDSEAIKKEAAWKHQHYPDIP